MSKNDLSNKKAVSVILICLCLTVGLSAIMFFNYSRFKEDMIKNEQDKLLTIAETTSLLVQNYMSSIQNALSLLSDDSDLVKVMETASYTDNSDHSLSQKLELFLQTLKPGLANIQILDIGGHMVFSEEGYPQEYSGDNEDEIKTVIALRSQYVGKVFFNQTYGPHIFFYEPILLENQVVGIICLDLSIDSIYHGFIEPIKSGNKGYASIKNSAGVFLMHPKRDQIGQNVLELRLKEFPEFNWTEMQNMFEIQMKGMSGSGIYQSVWITDENPVFIKKFNGYAPAKIGDDFWIVTVSSDYDEATKFVRENFNTTILTMSLIAIGFCITAVYVVSLLMKQKKLEAEARLLSEVKKLNVELEEDIEKRKILENKLIESRRKFIKLFNTGSHITFVLRVPASETSSVDILEVNDYACERLGYSRESLSHMNYRELDPTFDLVGADDSRHSKNGEQEYFETALMSSSGESFPVEVYANWFEIDSHTFLMLMIRDITEKKHNEEVLEKNRGILIYKSRLAAMGEMIASIAHQWRQPLSSLSLIISNIEDSYAHQELEESYFNEQVENSLSIIQEMSNVIDDFLFFFNPKDNKDWFNVEKMIRTSFDMQHDRIKIYEIRIEMDCMADVMILGYASQFSQVLLNIISNSVDALKSKTGDRFIKASIHKGKSDLIIDIQDNGGGIQGEFIHQVFNPYFSTKNKGEGTGIGLYISKMIIERNFKGKIECTNTDQGLLTRILIPREDVN